MSGQTAVVSKRLLVMGHEAGAGDALFAETHHRPGEGSEVLVLAPALTSDFRSGTFGRMPART